MTSHGRRLPLSRLTVGEADLPVTASKLFWLLAQPLTLVLLLALLSLILLFTRLRWMARIALGAALAILVLAGFTTLGQVLLQPLEAAFDRPARPPAAIDGIIVLGGGMSSAVNAVRGGYELNPAGDRFVEALRLAQAYPEARIVISGGIVETSGGSEAEAVAGERFFVAMGVAPERLILESAARNTAENAALTEARLSPQPGETWLLVTSAYHMPRAVGSFRMAGFDVVPWPTDYRASGRESFRLSFEQPAENLYATTVALREWIGLAAYYVGGRTDDWFPRPRESGSPEAPAS